MKILLVNKFLMPRGGAETYVFDLGKQLEKMGHEVQYFGMDDPNRIVGNSAEQYVKRIDFHQSGLGLSKLSYPFKIIYSSEAKKKLTKVLLDFKPDIVHLNNFNFQLTPSIIYAVRSAVKKYGLKTKIVHTVHDTQLVCPDHLMLNPITLEVCEKCVTNGYFSCIKGKCIHGSTLRSVLGTVEGWLYRRLNPYKYIDLTVCPSAFIKTKITLIPEFVKNPVVLRNFVKITKLDSDIKKENYVLYFGRFSPEKGFDTFAKACRALPKIKFVVAGAGPLEGDIAGLTNVENKGFLTGKELHEVIGKALFNVTPSQCYENCPFSVLESISCKTPVLGANIGGIPELIKNGEDGLLFESKNIDDLCEKITYLWEHREVLDMMTENCGNSSFMSIEAYSEKLLALYESVLNRN